MEDLISIKNSLVGIAEELKQDRNDLYKKLLGICSEIDILFLGNDDYSWPMTISEFCNNFNINKNTVNTHKRKYLIKGEDYFIGHFNTLYFERRGALKIFEHSKSEKGTRYLRKYGLILSAKEEHLYKNIIEYAVSGFEIPKKEFKVKTLNKDYYIDLYLHNKKLAIECDEYDHYWQEDIDKFCKREAEIINKLGCRFLRFNPHESDFNVGEVINVIFHYIFNKTINEKDPIDYYMGKRKRTIRERNSKLSDEELAAFE